MSDGARQKSGPIGRREFGARTIVALLSGIVGPVVGGATGPPVSSPSTGERGGFVAGNDRYVTVRVRRCRRIVGGEGDDL
jgi:hypothetical protein